MRHKHLLLSGTILSLAMLSSAYAETFKLAQAPQPPGQAETKPEPKLEPKPEPKPAPAPAQQQPRPPQPPAAAPAQPPHPASPPAAQPHPQPPAPPAARPAAPPPAPAAPAPRAEPKAEPPKAAPAAPAAQTPARPPEQRQEQRQDRREERRENRQEQRSAPTPGTAPTTPAAPSRSESKPPESKPPQPAQTPTTPTPPAAQQQRPATPPAAQQGTPPQQPPATATPSTAPTRSDARTLDQLRQQRQETREGDRTIIRENDRTIVRQGDRTIIRHNESDRFRTLAPNARVERRGNATVTEISRPGGVRVFTETDADGRLLRRYRRDQSGREIVIIDNRRPVSVTNYYVDLPPPRIRIPRERYIVEADRVDERVIYETLIAPPVEQLDRRYTIDQVRYSPEIRARMPRVDLDTVTFDTGSWEVAPNQARSLAPIAEAINRAVQRNPREVFLIEGHTDAVGNDVDNLSLSDRRAESVAVLLTEQFNVPPENLVTQGYGEQYLKVQSDGPERQNRRVTVRRITPLLAQGDAPPPPRRR
ncbi:MAG: OmpA family protein [Pseudolabrys sp.]|nr:OmpA family protein [Pseudolabrys sp.]